MTTRYRKFHVPIRLERALYAELDAVVSVTIGVKDRQRVFADDALAADAVDVALTHALVPGTCVVAPDAIFIDGFEDR